jgi:hypothetical protein
VRLQDFLLFAKRDDSEQESDIDQLLMHGNW